MHFIDIFGFSPKTLENHLKLKKQKKREKINIDQLESCERSDIREKWFMLKISKKVAKVKEILKYVHGNY